MITEESFLNDVNRHEMFVFKDDGLYRHIRFARPESNDMQFDLITWPGHLCYCGDMGSFVFQRTSDMFSFFRSKPEGHQGLFINTGYWAEKCISEDGPRGIREYSPEAFREEITRRIEDIDDESIDMAELQHRVSKEVISFADDGEHAAREAVDNFEFHGKDIFPDFWEATLTRKTNRFVWCCYAIAWGISKYDGTLSPNDGLGLIRAERRRQVSEEGWSAEHDDGYDCNELKKAAFCYDVHGTTGSDQADQLWPWDAEWWKPTTQERSLVKAGALYLAEADRLSRLRITMLARSALCANGIDRRQEYES